MKKKKKRTALIPLTPFSQWEKGESCNSKFTPLPLGEGAKALLEWGEGFRFAISVFVILFVFSVFAVPALARSIVETSDPMVIGGGARPLGMARAFAAIGDDSDAPLINPAGTGGMESPQLMSMFTNLMGDIYYNEFTGATPTPWGTIGFGYVNTGIYNLDTYTGTTTLTADYHDRMYLISYSTPLARFLNYGKNIFIGGNLKYFSRGFTGGTYEVATSFSLDYGVKIFVNPNLSLALVCQNALPVELGGVLRYPSGAEEMVSSIYKFGLAVKPANLNNRLVLALDLDMPASSGRPSTVHIGTEYKATPNLWLRGGLDQSVDAATASRTSWNPAFGASLINGGLRLDYAYHPYYNDPTMATSYVSISYQLPTEIALEGEVY